MRWPSCWTTPLALAVGLAGCGGGGGGSPTTPSTPTSPTTQTTNTQRQFLDLVYTTVPRSIGLNLFLPASSTPTPLVVYIHGCGDCGSKENYFWNDSARGLREQGFAVAIIDYRLGTEARWPAQLFDAKAAIRWLRANASTYNIDANRVGVWGDSFGGTVVCMLGLTDGMSQFEDPSQGNASYSSRVQAVVNWYGVTRVLTANNDEGWFAMLGCWPAQCPDAAASASPVLFVRGGAPPFLVMHGTADDGVPVAQSDELVAALQKAGVAVDYRSLGGLGHGGMAWVPQLPTMQAWLKNALR
jgi:acetyl esterase/lipase